VFERDLQVGPPLPAALQPHAAHVQVAQAFFVAEGDRLDHVAGVGQQAGDESEVTAQAVAVSAAEDPDQGHGKAGGARAHRIPKTGCAEHENRHASGAGPLAGQPRFIPPAFQPRAAGPQ